MYTYIIIIELSNDINYYEREQFASFYFHFVISCIYYECMRFNESLILIYIEHNDKDLYNYYKNINKLNLKYYLF
jgi:hypothetical protein